VAEILGKVTRAIEPVRGADVVLKISVLEEWLLEGRCIEVELPRNLVCAQCGGGGCSKCNNSGAVSLRGRNELPEMVQVSLPEQGSVDSSHPSAANAFSEVNDGSASRGKQGTQSLRAASRAAKPVTIRIPECGGLPESGSGATARGLLLLQVNISDRPSECVSLLDADEEYDSSRMLRAEVRSMQGEAAPQVASNRPTRSVPVTRYRSDRARARILSRRPAKVARLRRTALGVAVSILILTVTSLWMWYVR
jgi:hypothetical protein